MEETLKKNCDLKNQCKFYLKYNTRTSNVWRGLINIYCLGSTPYLCERRKHYYETGSQPNENLMPTGKQIPNSFLALP